MKRARFHTRVARGVGTWLPVAILLLSGAAYVDALMSDLTWERPVAYFSGFVSLFFGLWAIFDMMNVDRDGYTSFFLLTLFYQKLCLMVTFLSIFFFAANEVLPWVPAISEALLFALLVSSISALVFVNFGIYLGRRYEFLDLTVDFVPFRPLYRRWRSRRRGPDGGADG